MDEKGPPFERTAESCEIKEKFERSSLGWGRVPRDEMVAAVESALPLLSRRNQRRLRPTLLSLRTVTGQAIKPKHNRNKHRKPKGKKLKRSQLSIEKKSSSHSKNKKKSDPDEDPEVSFCFCQRVSINDLEHFKPKYPFSRWGLAIWLPVTVKTVPSSGFTSSVSD